MGDGDDQQGEKDRDERVGEEMAAEGHAQAGDDRGIGGDARQQRDARRGRGQESRGGEPRGAGGFARDEGAVGAAFAAAAGLPPGGELPGPAELRDMDGRARSQTSLNTPLTTRTGAAATVRKRKSAARADMNCRLAGATMCWRSETRAAMPMAMVGHMLTRRRTAAGPHSLIQKPDVAVQNQPATARSMPGATAIAAMARPRQRSVAK